MNLVKLMFSSYYSSKGNTCVDIRQCDFSNKYIYMLLHEGGILYVVIEQQYIKKRI